MRTVINRNPKATLPRDAQFALGIVRDHIIDRQLANVLAHPIIEAIPDAPIDGFAAASRGGVSIFYVDATNAARTGQWSVQMCAGIAVDCQHVDQALLWANASNRRAAIDRCFCAIAANQSMCGVAADASSRASCSTASSSR